MLISLQVLEGSLVSLRNFRIVPGHFALTGPNDLSHFAPIKAILVNNSLEVGHELPHLLLPLIKAVLQKPLPVCPTDIPEHLRSQQQSHI